MSAYYDTELVIGHNDQGGLPERDIGRQSRSISRKTTLLRSNRGQLASILCPALFLLKKVCSLELIKCHDSQRPGSAHATDQGGDPCVLKNWTVGHCDFAFICDTSILFRQ